MNDAAPRSPVDERRALGAAIVVACGGNRRDRPRDPEKAAILRSFGVDERLIGPVAPRR